MLAGLVRAFLCDGHRGIITAQRLTWIQRRFTVAGQITGAPRRLAATAGKLRNGTDAGVNKKVLEIRIGRVTGRHSQDKSCQSNNRSEA